MVAEQFGESMGKRRDGGSEGMEAITRAAKIGRTAGTQLTLLHYNDFLSNLHRALWNNVSGTISDQSKYTHSYVSPLLPTVIQHLRLVEFSTFKRRKINGTFTHSVLHSHGVVFQ